MRKRKKEEKKKGKHASNQKKTTAYPILGIKEPRCKIVRFTTTQVDTLDWFGRKGNGCYRLQLSILLIISIETLHCQRGRAQAGQQSTNFPLQGQDFGVRVVHASLDPSVEAVVAHGTQVGLTVHLGLLRCADDLAGDHDTDLTDPGQVRVEESAVDLLSRQGLREGLARGVNHAVGNLDGLGQDGSHTNTGEDIHVVALAGVVDTGLSGGVGEREGLERGARGKEGTTVSVLDGSLKITLRLGRRVGQWEDDGGRVPVCHLADDLGSEDTTDGRQTHEDGRLHMVNHILEGLELLALVVCPGKVDLVVSQLVATIHSDQTLGVHQAEARAGLILGQALTHEEIDNLSGNTNSGTSRTEEYSTMVLARKARALHGVDDTTKDDSSGTLDIIVEAREDITITLQSRERILEVFKLDNNAVFGNHTLPLAPGYPEDFQ